MIQFEHIFQTDGDYPPTRLLIIIGRFLSIRFGENASMVKHLGNSSKMRKELLVIYIINHGTHKRKLLIHSVYI